jgi:membrane protease YdiL (CAAX protease family)
MPNDTPDQPYLFQPLLQPPPEVNPPQELWKLRDLVILIVFVPVAYFISNIVAFAGYAVLKPLLHWHSTPGTLEDNAVFLLALQSMFYLLLLAYIYLLVTVHYGAPFWAALHWRRIAVSRAARFFLGGVGLSFLVMLAPSFLPENKNFPLEKMFSRPANAYAIAIFAVVVAPFMEELLFRGVLFAFFEKNGGLRFAILGTAVLFAALHVPEYWGAWDHVVLILVVGLVLSSARGLTDSLSPSVVLHFAYNATLMAMLYLQTDQFHKLPAILHF